MRSSLFLPICALCVLCGSTFRATAAQLHWPDKHGPTLDGRVPDADATKLPLQWNEASGKNIAWKTPLEDEGHSTPVIAGDRIWFTASTEDGKKNFVYCIDRNNGVILHHKLLFENADPEPLNNSINNYAAPSCVLEEDAVYAHFGSYGTARLDPATAGVVWERRDIECSHFRGPGSSPVLFENLLILTFDGVDRQFTMALDKETGKTVWTTPRSTDYGDLDENGEPKGGGDFRKAYNTPMLAKVDDRIQLLSVGSRAAFAYDARTGEEIWTVRHKNYNAGVRPLWLPALDMAVLNTGSGGAHLVGVKLNASTRGDVTDSHVAWDHAKRNSQFGLPIFARDRLLQVDGGGIVSCLDAATGDTLWAERIPDTYVASPIAADNRIYFFNEQGLGTVLNASGEFEILAQNQLDEGMTASPAVAGGALFLRTKGHLYKIALPGSAGGPPAL